MHTHRPFMPVLATLAAALLWATSTAAQATSRYTIEALSFNATDINSGGVIVGGRPASFSMFVYDHGVTQMIDNIGSAAAVSDNGLVLSIYGYVYNSHTALISSSAPSSGESHGGDGTFFAYSGINNAGTVVGTSYNTYDGSSRGMVIQNGQVTVLPQQGVSNALTGINNQGVIAGYEQPFGPYTVPGQAYRYDNGTVTNLGTLPNGQESTAMAINDAGQVVGKAASVSEVVYSGDYRNLPHAFISAGTGLVDLGTLPGDTLSAAQDLNNLGQVVGSSSRPNITQYPDGSVSYGYLSRAFLYDGEQMIDLQAVLDTDDSRNWELQWAEGISDSGIIIGAGLYKGVQTSFVLTPVPEAGTGAMLLTGLGLVAAIRRRQQRG